MEKKLLTKIAQIEMDIRNNEELKNDKDFSKKFLKSYEDVVGHKYSQLQEIEELIYINYNFKDKRLKFAVRVWEQDIDNIMKVIVKVFEPKNFKFTKLEAVELNCESEVDNILNRSNSIMLKEGMHVYIIEDSNKKYTIYYTFRNGELSYLSCRPTEIVEIEDAKNEIGQVKYELSCAKDVLNKFLKEFEGNKYE